MSRKRKIHTFAARRNGFTLIETLVYLTLFTIIVGGMCMSVYMFFAATTRNAAHAMLQDEAEFILRKSAWLIASATTVYTPSSGGTNQVLSVRGEDGIVTLCRSGAVVAYAYGDLEACRKGVSLVDDAVVVTRFTIVHSQSPEVVAERYEIGIELKTTDPHGATILVEASTTQSILP
jgi:Tfp pilus assembly protein PilX